MAELAERIVVLLGSLVLLDSHKAPASSWSDTDQSGARSATAQSGRWHKRPRDPIVDIHGSLNREDIHAAKRTRCIQEQHKPNFDDHDVSPPGRPGSRSAIVSAGFVKRYLAGRNPLGTRICLDRRPDAKPTMEIVGIMSDFSCRGLRDDTEQAYFPFYEGEHPFGTFYVRVRGNPEPALESLRAIVRSAAPTWPMTDFRTLDEQVHRSLNAERMLATLSGSFSTIALLLSLVGLYGVMSFVATQRTHEIGIRLALGARRWSTIWLVLRDGLV